MKEHLRVLLNTRRGGAPSAPVFGVIDLSDMIHEFPAGGAALQMAIWETISIFEPRLTNVRVQQVTSDSPLVLRFDIAGMLVLGRGREPFRVSTQVHASGHVNLR